MTLVKPKPNKQVITQTGKKKKKKKDLNAN